MQASPKKTPTTQFIALIVLVIGFVLGARAYGEKRPIATTTALNDLAIISTDKGDITVELYEHDAPKTVDNFKQLAKRNYYNGIIFHRIIQDFMIQTGDPTGTGTGGESAFGQDFEDEINNHKIIAGTVAMANRGANTNGSQFFIVTEKPQPQLDGKHTVFGHVTDGMDVVRAIAAETVDENDKPKTDIHMKSVAIQER